MNKGRVRLAEIVLIAVVVLGTLFVMDAVVGSGLVARPYDVTVRLNASGGLYPGAQVSYRGNRVGKVTDLTISPTGVVARAQIRKGIRIPRDTLAVVSNLSAVGEQRLDFRPHSDGGPYLEDGDVLTEEQTRLPLPSYKLFAHANDLIEKIDLADVRTITSELDAAFGDQRVDLRRTFDMSDRTLAMLEELEPATISLLERGAIPLQTMADHSEDLRQFTTDLDLITRELRAAEPDLRRLIIAGSRTVPLLHDVLDENASTLGQLLARGTSVTRVGAERQPALSTWLDFIPLQARAMIEGTRAGAGRVLLVPNPSPLCRYETRMRRPDQTEPAKPQYNGRCSVVDPVVQQRGAQYVPVPEP